MKLHNSGSKADRDRAVVLHSYNAMVKFFRIPRDRRLSPAQISAMATTQLYQASKDLYNDASVDDAKRLAYRLGVGGKPEGWLRKLWRRVMNEA